MRHNARNRKRNKAKSRRRRLQATRARPRVTMRSIMTRFAFGVDDSKLSKIQIDVHGTGLQLKLQAARKALQAWRKENPEAARRQTALIWPARLLRRYLARDEKGVDQ